MERAGYTLAKANQQKFQIRKLLAASIQYLRAQAVNRAYQ